MRTLYVVSTSASSSGIVYRVQASQEQEKQLDELCDKLNSPEALAARGHDGEYCVYDDLDDVMDNVMSEDEPYDYDWPVLVEYLDGLGDGEAFDTDPADLIDFLSSDERQYENDQPKPLSS